MVSAKHRAKLLDYERYPETLDEMVTAIRGQIRASSELGDDYRWTTDAVIPTASAFLDLVETVQRLRDAEKAGEKR